MGLDFLHPAMLGALGAAAAPLVIHLLTKRRPKNWEFPSIRFIRMAVRRRSRIHRLQDLILLALRTLAVLLIVFTFARPVLTHWAHAGGKAVGSEALILIDDSFSMDYRGNPSPFEAAKAKAGEILGSLERGDSVNVWFLTKPKPVLSHFSDNVAAVETAIREAEPSLILAEVQGTLSAVREYLNWESAESPRVYVLSDFQRANWAPVQPETLTFGGRTVLVDTSSPAAENRAVISVRTRPKRPAMTENVSVTCQVANYGPETAETTVRFALRDEMPVQRTMILPAYGTADTTFHVRFAEPGFYRGTVSIDEDRLDGDNRRTVVFRVEDQIPVLLVSDAHHRDARSGAYFLRRALSPGGAGLLRVEMVESRSIEPELLGNYEVVLMSEVKLLSRDALSALHEFIESGGSMLYFLSRNEDRGNVLALEGLDPDQTCLPFRPGDLFDLYRFSERTLAFGEANYDSRLLQFFRDPENGDLSTVHARRFFTTEEKDEMAETLLAYSDGTVALAQQRVGAGAVVLANFSPERSHTDLARRNIFPPLVHEMVKGLRLPPMEAHETHPGESLSVRVELEEGAPESEDAITVRDPEGSQVPALLNRREKTASVTLSQVEGVGFYSVLVNDKPVEVVAVNIHPDESDLRALPPDGLRRLTEGSIGSAEVKYAPMEFSLRELEEGKIIWPFVLLAGLFFLLSEGSLAYRWRTR